MVYATGSIKGVLNGSTANSDGCGGSEGSAPADIVADNRHTLGYELRGGIQSRFDRTIAAPLINANQCR